MSSPGAWAPESDTPVVASLPDTFSGKRAHALNGKAPAVFGAMKGQTTGQMRGSNLWLLVPALRKQEPEVEPSQAKKAFVSSIDPIKSAAMSMVHASRAQMRHPPHGQKEHHQVTIEVADHRDRAALDLPASAFGILKGRFHPHAPAIHLDQLATSRQIGDHHPDLFVARFPAHSQRSCKAVLLPNQGRAVPLLTWACDELSPTLPGRPAALVLAAHLVFLGNAQDIMPLDSASRSE